tara:strand:+ start:322 stop:492 length:171 start_codon:yes stop_codon:yes gene_type:complete
MYDESKAEQIYQQWLQLQQGTPPGNITNILKNELGLTVREATALETRLAKKYQNTG